MSDAGKYRVPRQGGLKPRVLFLNRSYWPDVEATGRLLTELCEDLSASFDVTVIAGPPHQNPSDARYCAAGTERRGGVRIERVWSSRFAKASLAGRIVNLLSYLAGAAGAAFRVPAADVVVAETDPPVLCFLGAILKGWHRAKLVCYVQDIYPDLAVALGKIPAGCLARWLRKAMVCVYRHADRVIVPSHDMRRVLVSAGVPAEATVCIPNWIDTRRVVPVKQDNAFRRAHGLDGRFLVMYSGNLGLCQPLDDVVRAAERLRGQPEILFTFVGDGVAKRRLQGTARRMGLANVRFFPYQAESALGESLSAADLHLVPLDPRVASYLMPSKLYGVLASGTAVLALAPEGSETARIVRDRGVGIVVAPGQPDALAEAILKAAANRAMLQAMGREARRLAQAEYDRRASTGRFAALLGELVSSGPRQWSQERPHERRTPLEVAQGAATCAQQQAPWDGARP